MTKHIEQRRQGWYAVLKVPQDVQDKLGRTRFRVSLKTRDIRVAAREAGAYVAEWQRRIDLARGAEPAKHDPAFWRDALRQATADPYDPPPQHRDAPRNPRENIEQQIEAAAYEVGMIEVDRIGDSPIANPAAREFFSAAMSVSTSDHLDGWLAASRATRKTQDMQRADVQRFAKKFPTIRSIARPAVKGWITGLMNDETSPLSPKTVQRILSALRGYWRYLQSVNVAADDHEPFAKLDVARQTKRSAPATARQPFAPRDVVKLLTAAKDDAELADLIDCGRWSGARIEELCALKIADVDMKRSLFRVTDAKTAAGWREVPIHAKLKPVMRRLIGKRKEGYVLAGLSENKYGDRSNAIGKRFGKLKTKLGFGRQYVFHSIRKTVSTLLDNAGVQEHVAAAILGHDVPTMTYGLYSGGPSLAAKREALAKLAY